MRWLTRYIILVILVCCLGMVFAGEKPAGQLSTWDSTYVQRSPGADFLEKYKNDAAFDYNVSMQPTEGLWDWIKRWIIERWLRMNMSDDSSRVLDWVMYGCMIVFGGWLFVWLFRHRKSFRWKRRGKGVFLEDGVAYNGEQEEEKYDRMLKRAEQDGDYGLAVRVNYSGLLQVLDKREIIRWQASKTNRDYVYEIKDGGWSMTFSDLTRIFDHVCYGEFAVDEVAYRTIKQRFTDFRKELEV